MGQCTELDYSYLDPKFRQDFDIGVILSENAVELDVVFPVDFLALISRIDS